MKEALPLLLLITVLFTTHSLAQPCHRDSSLLQNDGLLSPTPYTVDAPYDNLKIACIQQPYHQSLTIHVPGEFNYLEMPFPILHINLSTNGAIGNYPAGMHYACDPPNCVFDAHSLGCILLYGTPDPRNPTPDTLDLLVNASISTPFAMVPMDFPDNNFTPSAHWRLRLCNSEQCPSAATHEGSPFSALSPIPYLLGQQTLLEFQSRISGQFPFEVYNALGNRIHTETLSFVDGINRFQLDASHMPAGAYWYTLGVGGWKMARPLVNW